MTLTFDGHSYTICGVYRRNAALSLLSGDGTETIYVSANSGFDRTFAVGAGIQRVMVLSAARGGFDDRKLRDELALLRPNADHYRVKSYTGMGRFMGQSRQTLSFLLGAAAVILLLEIAWCGGVQTAVAIASALKTDNLGAAVKKRGGRFALRFAQVCLPLGCAYLLFRLVAFDLFVPSRFVPADTLFDFNFYKNLIVGALQEGNVYPAYKIPGYEKLYRLQMAGKAVAACTSAGLAGKAIGRGRELVRAIRQTHNRQKNND